MCSLFRICPLLAKEWTGEWERRVMKDVGRRLMSFSLVFIVLCHHLLLRSLGGNDAPWLGNNNRHLHRAFTSCKLDGHFFCAGL